MTKTLLDLAETKLSRRQLMKGIGAFSALAVTASTTSALSSAAFAKTAGAIFPFTELPAEKIDTLKVAQGYTSQTLIRWGDKLTESAPAFDPEQQTATAQTKQFGYNNDFIAFMSLPRDSQNSDRGLLCVNHEYSLAPLMFKDSKSLKNVPIEQASIGHSVVEIAKDSAGTWQVNAASTYNRRINALDTVIDLSGPAAGNRRVQTSADPDGRHVIGTFGNCAGGTTPWGTVLTCEENIDGFFINGTKYAHEKVNHERMGIPDKSYYRWAENDARFDADQEPHEPNRYGWVVEYDPYNPKSIPKKRTALGRFKHEGATTTLAKDGRVVVYMGDDERFEYVYKFVTNKSYDAKNNKANQDLLDDGTLYVARFSEDALEWKPLVYGSAPLTDENGFSSQADVVIEARRAAQLMEATPMDRPEDIQTNPETGKVYVCLTNNSKRVQTNDANPRPLNIHGHILELTPENGDHTATRFTWDIFMLAGDEGIKPDFASDVTGSGYLSCPDNIAFDPSGNLWIATDGMSKTSNVCDGLYMAKTEGAMKAVVARFLTAPKGSEVCGPEFTPDGTTLFVAIQHPGDGGSYSEPVTRWPDFKDNMPPRPSVVAITKDGGGKIGT